MQLTPELHPYQVERLSDAAHSLIQSLPPVEPKIQHLNNKRKMSKELEVRRQSLRHAYWIMQLDKLIICSQNILIMVHDLYHIIG